MMGAGLASANMKPYFRPSNKDNMHRKGILLSMEEEWWHPLETDHTAADDSGSDMNDEHLRPPPDKDRSLKEGRFSIAFLLACFTMPLLISISIYFSTYTHGLEVERFAMREVEYMGNEAIDDSEYSLYSLNIEDYKSYGCCADEDRGWYPELLNTAEDVTISLKFVDQDGNRWMDGRQYSGTAHCPDGLNECEGYIVDDGTRWVELNHGYWGEHMGYISYERGFFTDANLIVATQQSYAPYELEIELYKMDQPGLLFFTIAIVPAAVIVATRIAEKLGKKEISKVVLLRDEYEDFEFDISYFQILLNTLLRSVVFSYYLTLVMWYLIDGDWWNNPIAMPMGLILALYPPFAALGKERKLPEIVQVRPQLWGALLSIPFCLIAFSASLFTIVGPAG